MLLTYKRLFQTLSHLKPIQAIYQIKNRVTKVSPLLKYKLNYSSTTQLQFFFAEAVQRFLIFETKLFRFQFLNLSKDYSSSVNWNDQYHGKLWNYNLQYLDFLKQDNIPVEIKVNLVKDLYTWLWEGKLPLEPYPVSLRIMNMVRFLTMCEIPKDEREFLYTYVLAEANYLSKNLEFHILANHLLENAFAWWMASVYFQKMDWIPKAEKLLGEQLKEQILNDGAHYELAPMYHQIILFRVLEAYNLTPNEYAVKSMLKDKAEEMLGWMMQMTLPNGAFPHFNDTTEDIAYQPKTLLDIAESIGLSPQFVPLNESGYRVFENLGLQLIADVEGIKPSYQPGHAHADTFSFVLNDGIRPIVVDPGISTYTISERRSWERSTTAHNTLTIDGRNSSQVWSGFRVGKRAKVKILSESLNRIEAVHDGYFPQMHRRLFHLTEAGLQIVDIVDKYNGTSTVECRLYLDPDIKPIQISASRIKLTENLEVYFDEVCGVTIENYKYCLGYNSLIDSKYILIKLKTGKLTTTFSKK